MKRILITLTLFFSMFAAVFAQAPQKFTYQAVVRNESNTLVRGTVGVRITILQGGANGTMVYQETHTAVTNVNGLMTLQVGGGAVMNGDFATIDWANGPYFLKTETDPTGGTYYILESVQQLLSVPYALYAGSAANSFSGDYNDLTNQPQIPQIPANVSYFQNDAGYITMDSVPAIPTNVSAFVNDAGYVTESTLTTENYITQNDLITNNYVTEADIPSNVSAFTNDAGYITMDSIPAIPTVPTNVSAFTNDAGYITMDSIPEIQTLPTNVSAFVNDAGYVTRNDLPSYQVLSISNDTIYLTNGGYVKLPTGFSGDYNDLTNVPPIPQIPENVSAFNNDAGYITMDSVPEIPTVPTNISAFVNDVGYLTTFTVQEAANIPTNVSAFNNDAGYITMDSIPAIPTVPTNVSAFVNDAGYVTENSLITNNYITQNDLITNNYVTEADIPTNVSAFNNDAGYITMDSIPAIPTVPTNVSAFTNDANYITSVDVPAQVNADWNATSGVAQIMNKPTIPTVPTNVSAFTNDAGYITESMLTTNNYITQNDLVTNNYVTEADIPTNVSAFTNDAGYITMDSIPAIPTVPTNVSAFVNDAGYLTSATVQEAANIPTNVSAFNNDAGYITMDSIPTIPMVPTNVSAFTNDAGYVTESTLTTNNYITQSDLITNNYTTTADIPTNVSAFNNDAGYITMDSIPAIPTNVSAFVNDAGYLTQATVQEAANIPTNVSAFTNDANYITLAQVPEQVNADWNATSGAAQIMNKPTIPTVPTNVSAFTNDADYITSAAIPTNVSAFTNDANYITSEDIPAYQVLSISNDTIYLSNGGYAVLPAGFDGNYNSLSNKPDLFSGNYNDLTDKPTIPTVPTNVSAFTNDANYITSADVPAIPTNVSSFTNDAGYLTEYTEQQILSISNDTIYLTGGSFVKLPAGFSGSYNDLTDVPENVSTFSNDAGYLTRDSLENYNISPADIQSLLDRIADLEQQMELPVLNTAPASSISSTSAVSGGTVVSSRSAVAERGVCWNTIGSPTISDDHSIDGSGTGDFVSSLSSLTPATTYYIRAYATNDVGTGYGPVIVFTTLGVPAMTTNYVDNINGTVATIHCSVISDNGAGITEYGVCWNTTGEPAVSDYRQTAVFGSNDYEVNLIGLTPSTTYYVCAYAVNSEGTGYGNVINFITANDIPYVTTSSVSPIDNTSVGCGGNVTADNGSQIIARGVCWSTNPNPTIADNHTEDGTGTGSFTSVLTGLSVGVTYYVRAYATNSTGTGYGEQETFNTWSCGISTIADIDGNTYNTVLIGTQCWMKENLKTTRFSDSTAISQGATGASPGGSSYWYYPNNDSTCKATYGLLYNRPVIESNPCPTGWHVPSQAEWQTLDNNVSHAPYTCSGGIAKALSTTTGWSNSTTACAVGNTPSSNNATGFSALPAGNYSSYTPPNFGYGAGSTTHKHREFGTDAYFWTTTTNWYSGFTYNMRTFGHINANKKDLEFSQSQDGIMAGSVRCLKN